MNYKPCFLIPCFNHGDTMPLVLSELSLYGMCCYIVDDGSSKNTAEALGNLATEYDWVKLIRHEHNLGKGGAVASGMKKAWQDGYTHAIQIDADGQHDLNDLPKLLELSQKAPESLISGRPIFDDSVPKSRLYGRYLTHVWVWIETLSFKLKDSMCGFRAYPLESCIYLLEHTNLGRRMDFDVEIMVRLFWQGVQIDFFETRVIYPEGGLSHFNAIKDNVLISWMHTKLFFGMLWRMPTLVARKFSRQNHWSKEQERGSSFGIKFMLWIYRVLGRATFNTLLYPVMAYFWLTGGKARNASQNYLKRVQDHAKTSGVALPQDLNSFNHFLSFGRSILDKVAAWDGDIKLIDVDFPAADVYREVVASGKGILVIGSHLGNLELCRALGDHVGDVKVNSLVFTQHAERFNYMLKSINPRVNINLIQVSDMGPDTAILLKQKIDAGEWVFIVADRTPLNIGKSNVWVDFLGEKAPFPQGPFILASLLRCPVYLMFGLNEADGFRVHFEAFAEKLTLPRGDRQQALRGVVQDFADRLGHHCMNAPLDWFNFFEFWKEPDEKNNA